MSYSVVYLHVLFSFSSLRNCSPSLLDLSWSGIKGSKCGIIRASDRYNPGIGYNSGTGEI
jgi:hypothetical protein